MKKRLFVDSIESIGMVKSPDNPESTVLIWKAKREKDRKVASLDEGYRMLAESRAFRERLDDERKEETMEKAGAESVGEMTTRAIDKQARAWHLQGKFFDVPLPTLRSEIRKKQPGLVELERSRESVAVAKSRVLKSDDRRLMEAFDFVNQWG